MECDREDALMEQEENCRKSLKTLRKALFMRLLVTAVLIWAMISAPMELWVIGLMLLVLGIDLAGTLPLVTEWKKQRGRLKSILSQYE